MRYVHVKCLLGYFNWQTKKKARVLFAVYISPIVSRVRRRNIFSLYLSLCLSVCLSAVLKTKREIHSVGWSEPRKKRKVDVFSPRETPCSSVIKKRSNSISTKQKTNATYTSTLVSDKRSGPNDDQANWLFSNTLQLLSTIGISFLCSVL